MQQYIDDFHLQVSIAAKVCPTTARMREDGNYLALAERYVKRVLSRQHPDVDPVSFVAAVLDAHS